jgi:phosphatidylinositol-3,4,5-trisphosphate 3-phosphatase/dual-specificity protein phosphatase PTEN
MYRNNMVDVQRFFNKKHNNKYKVYNLCSEKAYESAYFDGRVERFPFDDHNAPPFEIITPFCRSVDEWLCSHQDNIIVVHCKAGKGRTGVMICCYLVYTGECQTAQESLDFYAQSRTYDAEGVTIPSQRRFVKYYGEYMALNARFPYPQQKIVLKEIIVHNAPRSISTWAYRIKDKEGKDVFFGKETAKTQGKNHVLTNCAGVRLFEDVKIIFNDAPAIEFPSVKKKDLFHLWFNTQFHKGSIIIPKDEIDRANKDRKHTKYHKDFKIEIVYTVAEDVSTELPAEQQNTTLLDVPDDELSSRDSDEFTDPESFMKEVEQEYRSHMSVRP